MQCTNGINEGNILEPKCEFASPHPLTVSAERRKMLEEQFEELSLLKSSIPKYCRVGPLLFVDCLFRFFSVLNP